MEKKLYNLLYLLENKNEIHLILNDKGLYVVSERSFDKDEIYDLFIIKTYEACDAILKEIKDNPKLMKNIDMDGLLDMYSISKKGYNELNERIISLSRLEDEEMDF